MGAKKLLKTLSDETGKIEQELLEKARADAEITRKKTKIKVEKLEKKLEEELEQFENRLQKRELSFVKLEIKSRRLAREKEDYCALKEMTMEKLLTLPKKEREAILSSLVKSAKTIFQSSKTPLAMTGKFTFKSPKEDRDFIEKLKKHS